MLDLSTTVFGKCEECFNNLYHIAFMILFSIPFLVIVLFHACLSLLSMSKTQKNLNKSFFSCFYISFVCQRCIAILFYAWICIFLIGQLFGIFFMQWQCNINFSGCFANLVFSRCCLRVHLFYQYEIQHFDSGVLRINKSQMLCFLFPIVIATIFLSGYLVLKDF